MPFTEWLSRLMLAATLATAVCVPLGLILLHVSEVPATYPPLLPQQILAGTVGGALLTALGYAFLSAIVTDKTTRQILFCGLALVLLVLSFYLPYRLTYTTSPRFAGATVMALIGQGLLHTIVASLSVICFLSEKSEWA